MHAAVFWLYFLAMGICDATHDQYETNFFGLSALASGWLLLFMVDAWVVADAQRRNRQLCYDFDSFVFFAAAILAPYYLFATRRWRAIITLSIFLAMWLAEVASYYLSREIFS